MIRRFFSLFLIVCLLAPAMPAEAGLVRSSPLTGKDRDIAKDAFLHADRGNWKDAVLFAGKVSDKLVYEIIIWTYLTEADYTPPFSDLKAFILRHPTWPNQEFLRRRAEDALTNESPQTVVAWLGRFPPLSAKGKIALAQARIALTPGLVNSPEILGLLREGWVNYDFTQSEEQEFIKRHSGILREQEYAERIDRLLWEGKVTASRRIMGRVSPARQKLFNARILLMQDTRNAEDAARAVAPSLKGDPGLLYERIKWRERRGSKDDLESKLLALPKKLKYPERWWTLKMPYIYRFLSQKRYREAYQLSRNHDTTDGIVFAEGEFLAGWVALRFLNEPRTAYRHFYGLYHGVETPVSRARAAYWASRAARENGNKDIESNWLLVASQFPTVFYGQMAAIRRGEKNLNIRSQPEVTQQDRDNFSRNELMKAAVLLDAFGRRDNAKSFLKSALESAKTLGERLLITKYGSDRGELDLTIVVSKHAASLGTMLMETGYPVLSNIDNDKPERALTHAIIRQESMFDPNAKSPAGALGLMQLMPATAKHVAQRAGFKYTQSRLTSDPDFNITVGSRYLANLVDSFGGSYVLGIAAYNAGPGNVNKWLRDMGDPRLMKDTDMIVDWIELIPFKETRNYVQRVLEALQVYRHSVNPRQPARNLIVEDLQR